MVLFTIIWLRFIIYDYSNRPLFDIQNLRCSMHRRRFNTWILIVYVHPIPNTILILGTLPNHYRINKELQSMGTFSYNQLLQTLMMVTTTQLLSAP